MQNKLLGMLAIAALVAGCESTEVAKEDGAGTFGEWPNGASEAVVPGSKEDFSKNVGDRVHFSTNKSNIDKAGNETLARQAEWLKKWPSTEAILEGHADERGTTEYNMALGQRRAKAAKKVLVAGGISEKRLEVVSLGKERPEAQGHDEHAWAQNRRAVTVIR